MSETLLTLRILFPEWQRKNRIHVPFCEESRLTNSTVVFEWLRKASRKLGMLGKKPEKMQSARVCLKSHSSPDVRNLSASRYGD